MLLFDLIFLISKRLKWACYFIFSKMGDQFVNAVERLHEKCGLMSFELWKIRKNKDEGKNGSTDDFNTLSTKLRYVKNVNFQPIYFTVNIFSF